MMTKPDGTPEEIERDIERTRFEIGNTLDTIQERLSPGKIVGETLGHVSGGVGEFASNLGRAARDNPIPSALVGLGLGWLLLKPEHRRQSSRHTGDGKRDGKSDNATPDVAPRPAVADKLSTAQTPVTSPEERFHRRQAFASSIAAHAGGAGDTAQAVAQKLTAGVQDKITRTRVGVRKRAKRFQRVVAGTFKDQPMVVGVLGLAIGVAVGAALPARSRAGKDQPDVSQKPRSTDEPPVKKDATQPAGKEKTLATNVGDDAKTRASNPDDTGRTPAKTEARVKTSGTATENPGKSKT